MQIVVRLRPSEKLGRTTVPPTVSLLRYAYDADAKRARQSRLGTVNFWADELPVEIQEQLTPQEIEDWKAFVRDRDHQQERALWRFCLANSVRMLAYASKALDAGDTPPDKHLAWSAINVFSDSLDKAGYAREKRERGRPKRESLLDASYLLLRTEEEREWWIEHQSYLVDSHEPMADVSFLLSTPSVTKNQGRKFPSYPEGDLVARAMKLAFLDVEDAST